MVWLYFEVSTVQVSMELFTSKYQCIDFMLDVGPFTCSVSVSALLAYATGASSWRIAVPSPILDASIMDSDWFVNIKVLKCCSGRYCLLDYAELTLMQSCLIELYVLLCQCPEGVPSDQIALRWTCSGRFGLKHLLCAKTKQNYPIYIRQAFVAATLRPLHQVYEKATHI